MLWSKAVSFNAEKKNKVRVIGNLSEYDDDITECDVIQEKIKF